MNRLKRYTLAGIFFVSVIGTLSHFLYQLSGNSFLVGLFAPVGESTWEHIKLLFFPMRSILCGCQFVFGRKNPVSYRRWLSETLRAVR